MPKAPTPMTEPARRPAANDIPTAIGSAASTIEDPGIPNLSFKRATAAAAAHPHIKRTSSLAAPMSGTELETAVAERLFIVFPRIEIAKGQ